MIICLVLPVLLFFSLLADCAFASDPCLECHEKKTPAIVDNWKGSIHFKKQVGCKDCHGINVEANHKREVMVNAASCSTCHKKPFDGHKLGKHGTGLKTGRGCTRNMEKSPETDRSCSLCHAPGSTKPFTDSECAMFLAQKPEMQRQGCDSCHKVEDRCDTCHTKHGTDLSVARAPATCGICHMGPDHAQYEMWETSQHGVIFKTAGEKTAPSCITCHMNSGSHNVSRGIATGLQPGSAVKKQERAFMLGICTQCHTGSLSKRNLDDADNIEAQSRALVNEAQAVIEGLYRDRLLLPMPSERPAHPLFGAEFVIGPHMLYENLSRIESVFFRMKQFHYMNTFKGAFHQNPDYTHWYGNAPLKLALSEIKSEALFLRKIDTISKRLENIISSQGLSEDESGKIRKELRELNERRLKGSISEKDYREMKYKILEEKGL